MQLDDAAIWTTLRAFAFAPQDSLVSYLGRRLLNRQLYKCIDVGSRSSVESEEDVALSTYRFHLLTTELKANYRGYDELLFDTSDIVEPYKWYGYEDSQLFNKILVKPGPGVWSTVVPPSPRGEPVDIVSISSIVEALRKKGIYRRIYVPDESRKQEIVQIMRGGQIT